MDEQVSTRTEGLRIAKNTALLALGSVLGMALGFVTTILVTDTLGEEYGLLLSTQRFVGFFSVIVDFGLATLLVRSVAAREDSIGGLMGTVLLLRGALGLVYGLLVGVCAFGLDYMAGYRWLLAAFVVMEFLGAMAETFNATCQGLEAMGRATLITLSRSVATCVFVVAAVALGGGLVRVMAAYLFGKVLHLLAAIWLTRRVAPGIRLAVRWDRILPLLRQAVLFVGVIGGYGALRSLDVVMLAKLSSVREVARYGAALNFVEVLLAVPVLVQTALLPAFARLTARGRSGAIGKHAVQVFSAVLLPAAVGLAILSDKAVGLYPSGEFADSSIVLRVLAGGFCFLAMASVSATLLTGAGRMRTIVLGYVVALGGQVVTNLVLIPEYGAMGAAAGTVTAYLLLSLFLMAALRSIAVDLPLGSMACHLVSTAVMSVAVVFTRTLPLPVPIVCGGVVYLTVLLLCSPTSSIERQLANELITRLRRSREMRVGS